MRDVVWIRLTSVDSISLKEEEEFFMFGPTGVVRFKVKDNMTHLFNSNKTCVGSVKEDVSYIMTTIASIRGTLKKTDKSLSLIHI